MYNPFQAFYYVGNDLEHKISFIFNSIDLDRAEVIADDLGRTYLGNEYDSIAVVAC